MGLLPGKRLLGALAPNKDGAGLAAVVLAPNTDVDGALDVLPKRPPPPDPKVVFVDEAGAPNKPPPPAPVLPKTFVAPGVAAVVVLIALPKALVAPGVAAGVVLIPGLVVFDWGVPKLNPPGV